MALSRTQTLAVLDLVQRCEMYAGVDIVSFAQKLSDAELGLYVSQHVMRLPHHDKMRALGAALEYERQEEAA